MGLANAPLLWLFAAAWLGCWLGSLPALGVLASTSGWAAPGAVLAGALAAASRRLTHCRVHLVAAILALVCASMVSARLAHHRALEAHITRGERGVFEGYLVDVEGSSAKGLSLRLRPLSAPPGADIELLASPAEVARALAAHPAGDGGRVAWPVRLYPYRRPGNPWEFDRWMWAARRGLVARAYFDDPIADPIWAESGPPACLPFPELVDLLPAIRKVAWAWRCRLHEALGEEPAAVAQAMLLGQKDLLDPGLREAFSRSGTAHLLAVSGVHVGFVAMAALAMIGRFSRASRGAWARGLAIGIGGLAIGSYVLLVGGPPSALRAGIMAVAAFAARMLGRRSDAFQTLGAAGVALLLVEPLDAFDLGFQLSFASTFGILAVVRVAKRPYARLSGVMRSVLWSLSLSTGAQAFTLPTSLGVFSMLPWLSPLVNVAAIPLGAAAILCAGAGLVAGELVPRAGALLIKAGGIAIELLVALARRVPAWGTVEAAAPHFWFTAGWYASALGLLETAAGRIRPSCARSVVYGRWAVVAGAALIACSTLPAVYHSVRGDVRIVIFDVGQGDSILIRGPWGRSVLVDGGPVGAGGYDAGQYRVVPALKRLGVRTIDAIINTHPDSDHAGGLAAVLRERRVRRVFASWAESRTAVYRRFVEAAGAHGIELERFNAGDVLALGWSARIAVLASGSLREWPGARPSVNDRSIVLAVENGRARFLLLGDTEDMGAARLMDAFDLASDGLLIPHHGSPGDFWDAFLERIDPGLAAISVGPNNYGHPSGELLKLLRERGVRTFRTDLCGAITVDLTRRGTSMRAHRASECRSGV